MRDFHNLKTCYHNSIVKVYNLFIDESKEKLYYVMEYVNGITLNDELKKKGKFDGEIFTF